MTGIMNVPLPSRETGQRSTNLSDTYITRFTPSWNRPSAWTANAWRAWVLNQPIAIVCRETLISSLLALDWKITPREMKYKDELDATIKYYTKLLENGGNNPELALDYSSLVEWILADLLDTPGGGWAEVGRKGDTQNGRVAWFKPIDSATMYPTLNRDTPAVQYWNGIEAIPFPSHSIARTYMTPRPWMDRQGWGIAPPEKVFFALELLNRGDKYYANLLLDIPTAGILDLGDMEKTSAEDWVGSFREFLNESDTSFRIPVLYEHNNPVNFIPFGKVPNEIMFDNITMKYAAIVCAAYGMSLGDIGLSQSSGGETLAGSIRSERKTKKTGQARAKSKLKYFFDQILPPTLQFNFVDTDDELNVAMGRARLASATAFRTWIDLKIFSPQELRSQSIADGLVSITLPDNVPPDTEFPEPEPAVGAFGKPVEGNAKTKEGQKKPKVQPGSSKVGNPKPPSSGGEGEMNARSLTPSQKLVAIIKVIDASPTLYEWLSLAGEDSIEVAKSELMGNETVHSHLEDVATLLAKGDSSLYEPILAFLDEVVEEVLELLGKSAVDMEENVDYDYIVESLKSRFSIETEKDNG